jgi:hypothetical protein
VAPPPPADRASDRGIANGNDSLNVEKIEGGVAVHLEPEKNISLRLGVRDADGRRSGSFGIYTSRAIGAPRDDIYIVGRDMGGDLRVSLHASGCRQVGNTKTSPFAPPPGSGKSRHYDTWNEPVKLEEGFYLEYALRFPTDHLRPMPDRRGDGRVTWIQAAPPGHCVEVVVCTADNRPNLNLNFNPGSFPVGAAQMLDGRFLILFGRVLRMGRHTNEALLVAGVREALAKTGMEIEPSDRLLVGYASNEGLRGWADYAIEQFLNEAEGGST